MCEYGGGGDGHGVAGSNITQINTFVRNAFGNKINKQTYLLRKVIVTSMSSGVRKM